MRARLGAVVLIFSPFVCAQSPPDALELLNESRNALRAFQSYIVNQQVVVETKNRLQGRLEMPVKLAASNPGKVRIESSGQLGSTLMVSDGRNTWVYLGRVNQYTKTAAASSPDALLASLNTGIGQRLELAENKDPYASAKISGEEAVQVEGKPVDCYVVEAALNKITIPGGMTLTDGQQKVWIDKKTKLAVKMATDSVMSGGPLAAPIETSQRVEITSFQVNQPVPDSLFVFTPPAGAREVAEFAGPVKSAADLTGKVAEDFTTKAADGRQISLHDLRGKVALVYFLTSWCLPCKDDQPVLDKLRREFGGDLTVISTDAGAEMLKNYGVTAYPTVVLIDREGTIVFYHVGAGSEKLLRDSLAKLGLSSTPKAPPR